MESTYKRIGDYVQEINVRNAELNVKNLLGINIDKFFMPSVANIVGTDMTTYKIVKNGKFACNRMHVGRDKRLPVALLNQADDVIVSPAYDVFEIKDKDVLNPEYLMMWFSRKEFDRNAWFYTDADVRGGLNWEDFCNMQLPVPSITKQKEIVKEYNVLVDRINLNNRLIQKLEETAQAIYKQWFVDFEFPDENGMPYKSNGGEMEFNKELDKEIPKGWRLKKAGEIIGTLGGGTPSTEEEKFWINGYILWYSPTDITNSNSLFTCETERRITKEGLQNSSAKIFPAYSLMMTSRATVGKFGINTKPATTNQGFIVMLPTEKYSVYYLYNWVKTQLDEIYTLASGSTFPEINKTDFRGLNFISPIDSLLKTYNKLIAPLFYHIRFKNEENIILIKTKDLLLSKLATMENNL
jgi:type I restriction enzyme S subunit